MAIEERYTLDVALGTKDDACTNVVVLSGVDLDVPLEADLDNDPYHDDEVLLESADGSTRHLTVSDPDVRLDVDRQVYFYRFRNVPPGIYQLWVRVGEDEWASIANGLCVDKRGASFDGKQLSDAPPPKLAERPEAPEPEAPPAAASSELVLDAPDYDLME